MTNAARERLTAVVRGRVRGVGFRYQTEREARLLGLHGYVRNRADRAVEVVAEGPRASLERLLAWLHHGPGMAYVTEVETSWLAASGAYDSFEVRY